LLECNPSMRRLEIVNNSFESGQASGDDKPTIEKLTYQPLGRLGEGLLCSVHLLRTCCCLSLPAIFRSDLRSSRIARSIVNLRFRKIHALAAQRRWGGGLRPAPPRPMLRMPPLHNRGRKPPFCPYARSASSEAGGRKYSMRTFLWIQAGSWTELDCIC
jgi:hypothetical protein